MPFTVRDLIVDKIKPVTIDQRESGREALKRMIEGDFSQLPVVDEREKVIGMITSDSIVRALNHLRLKIEDLKVSHATRPIPKTFTADEEIFDLLDGLKDSYAVLVVDKDLHVLGIVTNYDTAAYFRARAEDMMLVEDVENTIKDCIRVDLVNVHDEVEDSSLMVTVGDPDDGKLKEGYSRAIAKALDVVTVNPSNSQKTKLRQLVENEFAERPPKAFSELTLHQYISLFLEKCRWDKFGGLLDLPIDSCRNLLEGVRLTRNDLFHFRTELSADRRDELRYCRDLLNKKQQEIIEALRPAGSESAVPVTMDRLMDDASRVKDSIKLNIKDALEESPQLIEKSTSETSKYAPVATFLQTLPEHINEVLVTFEELESIIENPLPRAAYEHRAWWANDSVSHVQSKQWLEVGWRVASINISQGKVTFARIKSREQKYISFFSDLIARLRNSGLEMKHISPSGRSFLPMDNIASPAGDQITFISCSFARGGRFRVELYIDTRNSFKNDFIFRELSRSDRIQSVIRSKLEWESLDDKRASRIAAYHPGSITDPDSRLDELKNWAVERVIEFYELFQVELRNLIIEIDLAAGERYHERD